MPPSLSLPRQPAAARRAKRTRKIERVFEGLNGTVISNGREMLLQRARPGCPLLLQRHASTSEQLTSSVPGWTLGTNPLPGDDMRPMRVRTMAAAMAMAGGISLAAGPGWSAPTCPLSYNQTDAAKSHKLFLYFPAADDPTFPDYFPGV